MENKKKEQKGAPVFYIALCLCVALIGLFGYFSGRSTEEAPEYAAVSSPSAEPESEEVSSEFTAEDPLPTAEVYAELVTDAPLPTATAEPSPTPEPIPVAVYEEEAASEEVLEETPAPTAAAEEIATAVTVYAEDVVFSSPLSGEIAAGFSQEPEYNQTLREWRTHNGVDIAADIGTAVTAAADGTVESVSSDYLGTSVIIDHGGGWKARYANIATDLAAGGTVNGGDIVGTVAADAAEQYSQPHLHFELWLDGKSVDPQEEIQF